MKAHENVLVFYSNLPTYNPQKTIGHKPVNPYSKGDNSDGDCYGKTSTAKGGGNTDRYPRSVQVFSSDKQKVSIHPTQKPEALAEYFIKTYSNKGDLIVDTCMGSGALILPAFRLGRDVIGMDDGQCEKKKSKYFGWNWNDVVKDRITNT